MIFMSYCIVLIGNTFISLREGLKIVFRTLRVNIICSVTVFGFVKHGIQGHNIFKTCMNHPLLPAFHPRVWWKCPLTEVISSTTHPPPSLFDISNSFNQSQQPSHTHVRTLSWSHQPSVLIATRYFVIANNVNMSAFYKQYFNQCHVLQETRDYIR